MTLGEVREALHTVLDKIAQAIGRAHNAADLAEEARDLIGAAGRGTLQTDVEEVQGHFTKVVEGIGEPEGFTSGLATVADSIRSFDLRLGAGDGGSSIAVPAPSVSPEPGSPQHIALLRGQLPPPVRERGQKTHGRWFAPGTGDREIVSGEGAGADAAAEFLKSIKLSRRGVPFIASHVETKLAVHMRTNGIRHATVLINDLPCPRSVRL